MMTPKPKTVLTTEQRDALWKAIEAWFDVMSAVGEMNRDEHVAALELTIASVDETVDQFILDALKAAKPSKKEAAP